MLVAEQQKCSGDSCCKFIGTYHHLQGDAAVMQSRGCGSGPSGCTPAHHASSPAPLSPGTVGFIFSLSNALLSFSIAFKSYNPPAITGSQCWLLAEDEGRVSCGLERAACCLQGGKFVGVISFYCKSGGGYSCSLITLILFCLEKKKKVNHQPLWNIRQGK